MSDLSPFRKIESCDDIFLFRGEDYFWLDVKTVQPMSGVANGLEIIAYTMEPPQLREGSDYVIYFAETKYPCTVQDIGVDENSLQMYRLSTTIEDPLFWN